MKAMALDYVSGIFILAFTVLFPTYTNHTIWNTSYVTCCMNHTVWLNLFHYFKPGFEITTKILSCDRAGFRARQNWLSCTTKIVRDKNRARQKSCMNWILIQNKIDYLCLNTLISPS